MSTETEKNTESSRETVSTETEKRNENSTTMKKKVTLRSYDGELFEVDEEVAVQSETIKGLMEEDCWNGEQIPIPNVTSEILTKVIEYCKKHVEARKEGGEEEEKEEEKKKALETWDKEFANLEKETLLYLILAANYLNVKELMDLTCQTAADAIKSMTVEEVRSFFGIVSDFTPEEEEALREENKWAFD